MNAVPGFESAIYVTTVKIELIIRIFTTKQKELSDEIAPFVVGIH